MAAQNAWEFHGMTEEAWNRLSLTERVHHQSNRAPVLEPFDYPYLIEITPETYAAGTQRVQKLISEFINGGVMAVVTVQPAKVKEG